MHARSRRLLLSALVAGSFTLPLSAQDENALKRFQAQEAVIKQKIENEILVVIEEADKLREKSPEKAVQLLKAKITNVQGEGTISKATAQDLVGRLNRQIDSIEKKTPAVAAVPGEAQQKRTTAEAERAKATLEEIKEVNRSVETIGTLVEVGKSEQARKEADALAKRYPNNPAAIALKNRADIGNALNEARVASAAMREGYLYAMRSVDKAATPINGEIVFDKEYTAQMLKLRKPATLTAKEKAIMKSLDTDIMFSIKDQPFEEVLADLSAKLKTPILLDESAKNELKIDSSTLVSVNLRTVSARTALRKILQDRDLAFIVKNEAIHVTTAQRAKDSLVSRVYYVGDLVSGQPGINAVRGGPVLEQRFTQEMVDQLMKSILQVDPMSWEKNNAGSGHGSVTFHWPTMSFIVRQSAEVHAQLAGSLGSGR